MLQTQARKTLRNSIEVLSAGAHGNVLVNLTAYRVPLSDLDRDPLMCHLRSPQSLLVPDATIASSSA